MSNYSPIASSTSNSSTRNFYYSNQYSICKHYSSSQWCLPWALVL